MKAFCVSQTPYHLKATTLKTFKLMLQLKTEIRSKYHISPEDFYTKLSNLKRTKASGPDNLLTWIFKEFAMELSTPVADIFNALIQERVVPVSQKEADVIPIPKTDKVKEIENDLRPISLTSVFSKTMEHFVANWIMSQTGPQR